MPLRQITFPNVLKRQAAVYKSPFELSDPRTNNWPLVGSVYIKYRFCYSRTLFYDAVLDL